jgi:hypothetical protein
VPMTSKWRRPHSIFWFSFVRRSPKPLQHKIVHSVADLAGDHCHELLRVDPELSPNGHFRPVWRNGQCWRPLRYINWPPGHQATHGQSWKADIRSSRRNDQRAGSAVVGQSEIFAPHEPP